MHDTHVNSQSLLYQRLWVFHSYYGFLPQAMLTGGGVGGGGGGGGGRVGGWGGGGEWGGGEWGGVGGGDGLTINWD